MKHKSRRPRARPARWIRMGWLFLAIAALVGAMLLRVDAEIEAAGARYMVPIPSVRTADCILVLGASVRADGSVSPMLRDRLDVALALYEAGAAERILVSGDHGTEYYDEVNAMRDYLLHNGVPSEHVFMDHAGFDTYDSLYRARDVFQVRSCVISTQAFHLKRALFIARELGLEAQGVDAALNPYGKALYYRFREVFARSKAWLECRVLDAKPTFLGPTIPITGDGNDTLDPQIP